MVKCGLYVVAFLFCLANAVPYNTFDGPGFPACHDVAAIYHPTTVDEAAALVKNANENGVPVRASGTAHMWYDTMCSDDPKTIIIKTENLNRITDFVLDGVKGSVVVEAGVTFNQLADWLHHRRAALGFGLVNWNISICGAIATGAHRSSLKEDSQVSSTVLEMDIVNGEGEIVHLSHDESNDTWLAATTSLGLLGIIVRAKIEIFADFKVYADQVTLDESEVLEADLYQEISPYITANYWWWPGMKKFHKRTYGVDPITTPGEAFQSTYSMNAVEATIGRTLLNAGQNESFQNFLVEAIFYAAWRTPNFRDKNTNTQLFSWPVYGYAFDVIIGGLYPGTKPEWEYDLHGYSFEVAIPLTLANRFLKRVRELFDLAAAEGKPVTSTYRSGINIKFGRPFASLLGQTTTLGNAPFDWSQGTIMFDFASFRPATGNHSRYNEAWYAMMQKTLIDEFPTRPHWSKCTRDVLRQTVKNLDPSLLQRFAAVRAKFDPQKTFKSVVGEIIGVV